MLDPWLALAMFALSTFFISFPSGVSAAVIQEVTPNQLRSQMTAVYYLVINLVGLGFGALSVAVLTDRVFKSEASLGHALSVSAAVLGPSSALLIWWALRRQGSVVSGKDRPGGEGSNQS
jgi:hypothetical protein